MAEMIPNKIPSNVGSAKTEIFEILKHGEFAQDRKWVIFQSTEKFDFVILIRHQLCVICIDVYGPPAIPLPWRDRTISHLNSAKKNMENMRISYSHTYFPADSQLSLG